MFDRLPGPRISEPPVGHGDLPADEDGSTLRRFIRRRSAALVLIAIVVFLVAVYLVISLTMTRPLPSG